eukprot:EG_transcript_40760
MKEVAEWKHYSSLDDVLSTMPAHEATSTQCAIDCGQHNLGEPNPSIEFQQQPESQKSFLPLEDATEPIFPPMRIQFAPIIPLTDDFIHSDTPTFLRSTDWQVVGTPQAFPLDDAPNATPHCS